MPIIACSSCKSRFKVPIDTIGGEVECPRCHNEFKAVALHSGPRARHGTPPIAYAAIAIGALAVTGVIALMTKGKREPEKAPETITAKEQPAKKEPTTVATPPSEAGGMEGALETRARKIFDAMRIGGDPLLPGWIDYPRMHEEYRKDGLDDRAWTSLSDTDKYTVREKYLDSLPGNAESQAYLRQSTIESLEVKSTSSRNGIVELKLLNPVHDTRRTLTLSLVTNSGNWKIFRVDQGPIEGGKETYKLPDAPVAAPELVGGNLAAAEVAEVPEVEGTPSSVTRDIRGAISTLTDLNTTVEASRARRKLVEIGKPAIPHLLNALVPLDLGKQNDLLIAARVSNTLVDLTGRDFAIRPGTNEGSMMGEFSADNDVNLKRWFGWWKSNKNLYSGPPIPGSFDDEEGE